MSDEEEIVGMDVGYGGDPDADDDGGAGGEVSDCHITRKPRTCRALHAARCVPRATCRLVYRVPAGTAASWTHIYAWPTAAPRLSPYLLCAERSAAIFCFSFKILELYCFGPPSHAR